MFQMFLICAADWTFQHNKNVTERSDVPAKGKRWRFMWDLWAEPHLLLGWLWPLWGRGAEKSRFTLPDIPQFSVNKDGIEVCSLQELCSNIAADCAHKHVELTDASLCTILDTFSAFLAWKILKFIWFKSTMNDNKSFKVKDSPLRQQAKRPKTPSHNSSFIFHC